MLRAALSQARLPPFGFDSRAAWTRGRPCEDLAKQLRGSPWLGAKGTGRAALEGGGPGRPAESGEPKKIESGIKRRTTKARTSGILSKCQACAQRFV